MCGWLKLFSRLALTLLSALVLVLSGANSMALAGEQLLIKLGTAHFDPLQQTPTAGKKYQTIQAVEPGRSGYYLVQFDGPIHDQWKEALKAHGAEIFDYIPDYTFLVKMDSGQVEVVRGLDHVRWVGVYQPSYRVSQEVKTMSGKAALTGGRQQAQAQPVLLKVVIFPGEDVDAVVSAVTGLGASVLETTTTKWKTTLKLELPLDQVPALSAITGVKHVEKYPEWELFNNKATDIMGVRGPRDNHGLYGSGVTVAVCDTGLDKGSKEPANLLDDFEDGSGNSRVTAIFDLASDGASDVNSGHGTHVSGSVLGNGKNSGSVPTANSFPNTCFAGMAPKANLIMQAVENNISGTLTGIPDDLNVLFDQADTAGAQIHTNSWGSPVSGEYTDSSTNVDEYVWDHKDFLILYSAGNSGTDADSDGVVDLGSLGSPGTAKNCLTVGASENDRTDQTSTYGASWPSDFPVDPVKTDQMSDNTSGMAAFSSRGPCQDGRYKPDVVAPGTFILSTRSSMASGGGWGIYNNDYMYMGGTSMSTPLVAGTAALLREYLTTKAGVANPSAALMKAILINTADDMSPGQYGTGATQEIPDSPVPNNVEGWGRVDLDKGVFLTAPNRVLFHDEATGLGTGETKTYNFTVKDANQPFKVNLAWSDYPGVTGFGGLVNDLDLKVTDPNGVDHYPDQASPGLDSFLYVSGDTSKYSTTSPVAMKFTPASYPSDLSSVRFFIYNPYDTSSTVTVTIYNEKASGLPNNPLYSKVLSNMPHLGWVTTNISGVTINSGNFFVAISIQDPDHEQGLLIDEDGNPTGRAYYHNGSSWVLSTVTWYIGVQMETAASEYDRANNVVGLTLDTPTPGQYTVTVTGHNVPQGPQPFALVARGDLAGSNGLAISPILELLLDD